MQCYFWTCDAEDRQRVTNNDWLNYLDGNDPEFPERALSQDFERIRATISAMRQDPTTPDTRLADDPMRFNPATIGTLNQLMMAGLDPGRGAAPLHCRLRYFDPGKRRAGIPADTAALIDTMTADQVAVTLVNINQTEPRTVIVQTGAYAEHQCLQVQIGGRQIAIGKPFFEVRLAPGSGARLVIETVRYTNTPTLSPPWVTL